MVSRAITECEHRLRFGSRRDPVQILDGHHDHEHERQPFLKLAELVQSGARFQAGNRSVAGSRCSPTDGCDQQLDGLMFKYCDGQQRRFRRRDA
jgi:hypothetical protein